MFSRHSFDIHAMSLHNYENSIKLLYEHVVVITTIKRTPEFDFASAHFYRIHRRHQDEFLAFVGHLKVVDPVSESIILCHISADRKITKNILILSHSIDRIELSVEKICDIPKSEVRDIIQAENAKKIASSPFFERVKNEDVANCEEIIQKIQDIVDWLTASRIPHEVNCDTSEIIIGDVARIRPPYDHESNYVCPTRTMLKRVMYIVNSRPKKNVAEKV